MITNFVTTDIQGTNGVVHIIDGVCYCLTWTNPSLAHGKL